MNTWDDDYECVFEHSNPALADSVRGALAADGIAGLVISDFEEWTKPARVYVMKEHRARAAEIVKELHGGGGLRGMESTGIRVSGPEIQDEPLPKHRGASRMLGVMILMAGVVVWYLMSRPA